MSESTAAPALYDPARMRRYPWIVLAGFVISAVVLVATSHGLIDMRGKPLGYDFITFWGASDLTLHGDAAGAFDAAKSHAAQMKAVGQTEALFYWHYPPTFQLLAAPLALLPYPLAFLTWVALGLAAYLFALKPLLNQPSGLVLLAAFPATLICIYHGQNSLLSAALFGAAVWLSERGNRGALLAGACIGLLAYKPQLGILAPFAFAAAGQWRMFVGAALAALAFVGAATLAFGVSLWSVFLGDLGFVKTLLEDGGLHWDKMPSAWVFVRELGAPEIAAYGAQVVSALVALGVTVYVWRRCGMTRPSWAVLVAATLMVPHYTFDYELTSLAVPLAIVASDMAVRGASRGEKILLLVLVCLTGVTAPVTSLPIGASHVQIGFPLLCGVLWLSTRQALRAAGPAARPFLGYRTARPAAA